MRCRIDRTGVDYDGTTARPVGRPGYCGRRARGAGVCYQALAGGDTSVQNGSEWPSVHFNLNDFITQHVNVTNSGSTPFEFEFDFVTDSAFASLDVVGKLMQDGLLDITLSVVKQGGNAAPDGYWWIPVATILLSLQHSGP